MLIRLAIPWFGVCALLLTLSFVAEAQAQPTPLGTLIDIGGRRVHLYCTGAGSPTVVVVGGGYSFDWGLVQPEVARLTRICTYDGSGLPWSEPAPQGQLPTIPSCSDRIAEMHEALQRASVSGPYVIVGFSIGGLYGRLYAHRYAPDVAGMVIVDHAFLNPDSAALSALEARTQTDRQVAHQGAALSASEVDAPPVLISETPITLGIEDDQNFERLPERNRDLHAWAISHDAVRPTPESAAECAAVVERETGSQANPLGSRPLIVIRTNHDSPAYQKLQQKLLSLSHNSKLVTAEHSTHMVIIDAPETVTNAIREVVIAIRTDATPRE